MKAGLGGEKQPRGVLDYSPDRQKRAGDYSHWMTSEREQSSLQPCSFASWGKDCELWQMDLRGVDLGLVKDKLQRWVRDAIINHILVVDDTRKRPWLVAVPSQTPQPLLQTLLTAMFEYMPSPPSISLLTVPVLCTVSAGLRSALVIDIGWQETTVTSVYEYRETCHRRSTRAMKKLHWETAALLQRLIRRSKSDGPTSVIRDVSFEDSEEVLYRLVHCRPHAMSEQQIMRSGSKSVTIPLPTSSTKPIVASFTTLAEPTETTFFAPPVPPQTADEEEKPLPSLIYRALLSLPPDIRRPCLSRMILTGGGSQIPGMRTRICAELRHILDARGWDSVNNYGSARKRPEVPPTRLRAAGAVPVDTDEEGEDGGVGFVNKDLDPDSTAPVHLQPPLPDPVVAAIRSRTLNSKPSESHVAHALTESEEQLPEIRCVESLGAWAGASLMAGLHVKGAVDIERERFLQHGLLGGIEREEDRRKSMAPAQANRQSMITGAQPGQRNSGSWTLGVFG